MRRRIQSRIGFIGLLGRDCLCCLTWLLSPRWLQEEEEEEEEEEGESLMGKGVKKARSREES